VFDGRTYVGAHNKQPLLTVDDVAYESSQSCKSFGKPMKRLTPAVPVSLTAIL